MVASIIKIWNSISTKRCILVLLCFVLQQSSLGVSAVGQVKPKVALIGGDNVPLLKRKFEVSLENMLLEVNRLNKGVGSVDSLKRYFSADAYGIFERFVLQNRAQTSRKQYSPQMIERMNGIVYDIRSITLRIELGGTEASDNQSIIFSMDENTKIIGVRGVLPNYDYQSIISSGESVQDSAMRAFIIDFVEQFRMAYNSKDSTFLEKIYSDDALIIVGTILHEKKDADVKIKQLLSEGKVKLVQQTKREYLSGLRKVFQRAAFVNVRFEDLKIIHHEKIKYLYGVSCVQEWNTPTYSDKGYLFLMVDFRNMKEPVIHVRSWQPKAFEEDGGFIGLYDFDVVDY